MQSRAYQLCGADALQKYNARYFFFSSTYGAPIPLLSASVLAIAQL